MPEKTGSTAAEPRSFETSAEAGSALLDLMGERLDAFDEEAPAPNDEAKSEVEAGAESPEPDAEASTEASPEEAETVEEAPTEEASTEEEAEAEEPEAEVEEAEAQPKHKITVQGQELEVTLEEALAGFQRQSDYSRKTARLAAERREFEAESAGVRQEREAYAQRLAMLEQAIADTLPKEPDWEALKAEDPSKFAVAHADWQRKQEQVRAVRGEREKTWQKQAEEAQKETQRALAAERDKLLSAVPEWQKDGGKAKQEAVALVEYARDLGYSDEQINAVADHRVFLLLRKAWLYDTLQAKGGAALAKGKVKPATKPLQPGAKTPSKPKAEDASSRARKRLRSSGRPADAAAALEALLPESP